VIWDIDLGYGVSIWLCTISIWSSWISIHGIWANDMGDDILDMVILEIDKGYLVTLVRSCRIECNDDVDWGHSLDVVAQVGFENKV